MLQYRVIFKANTAKVMFDYQLCFHLPIACSITLPSFGHNSTSLDPSAPLHRHDLSEIDQVLFTMSVNSILDKKSIPFSHLFQLSQKEKRNLSRYALVLKFAIPWRNWLLGPL